MEAKEIKARLYDWLMEELAAREGGDNVVFSFDDATFSYIIYKKRYHTPYITLGYGRFLTEALEMAMKRTDNGTT